MNIVFTSKGRVIILLLLVSLFGLRLTASASARMKMVCDTDTTAKKKANKKVLTTDTTLVIKGGATILKNADTILIINGVPTKISKASPNVKPDPGINMDGGAKADSVAKGFQVAPTPKIRTIYSPTEGTIQVKNNPGDQPINTTIVAPPTDGVIQVRPTGNQGQVTTVPAPGGKVPAVIPGAVNANPPAVTKPDAGNANPSAGNLNNGKVVEKHDTTTVLKHDITTVLKHDTTTVLKHDTTTIFKKDTTTVLRKDTTTIIKKDTTTILQRDTITIIKRDTITINKRDTIGSAAQQTAAQDTTDYSEVKAKNYYLQIGGAGLAISANYDARFNAERNGWGYTVGIGGFSAEGNSVITVPFQINYLIGEHSSMIQVGGGTTFLRSRGNNTGKTWSFDKITGFVATGSFGYRYQPEHKGISFKVEFVPIMTAEGIIPAGGVSIGYTFK
ncbi:MAG: hypothetical protein JO080_04405 [Mucilaginibacter sp.]|nr:hypothetical protein [Mucilaginibacter sp.]